MDCVDTTNILQVILIILVACLDSWIILKIMRLILTSQNKPMQSTAVIIWIWICRRTGVKKPGLAPDRV